MATAESTHETNAILNI